MKTIIKKYLIVAFIFGTYISYAIENSKISNTVPVKSVKVEFKSVKKGHTLTLKDESATTIYKEEIQNSGDYSKLFNFKNIENGSYTIELEKDFEIIIKKMKVDNGAVSYIKETDKIFKPSIRLKSDLLLISKVSFVKKPLNITLYYKDVMIHSEKVDGENLVNRVYKLSNTEKGAYKVVIASDNRNYVKHFRI
jgi:hypothetical protein